MASFTKFLGLLKKDPVADAKDTFNIQTMLNENWDKVDAAMEQKAVFAAIASMGPDGGLDAGDLLTITTEGHLGMTEEEAAAGDAVNGNYKGGTTTAIITISFANLSEGARVGYISNFGKAFVFGYRYGTTGAGTTGTMTIRASVAVNNVEIASRSWYPTPRDSYTSENLIMQNYPVGFPRPDFAFLDMNWAAVLGRPLTNADTITITFTTTWTSDYGQFFAYADLSDLPLEGAGLSVRYLEV